MNMFVARNLVKCAALAALCVGLSARAEEKTATAGKAACIVPRSVFVNEPAIGADPFFPTSKRRFDALPRFTVTNTVAQSSAVWDCLKLQGMSGPEGQRLALVNGSTLAVGELADIKCQGLVVKVRCREIRERSVVLELSGSGETREIKLRDNI